MPLQIDVNLVARLVASQFPDWAHLPITPVALSGWDNRTFHLGKELTVRLPSAEHYASAVQKEQRWLPRIAAHLPLPIPTPLAMGSPGNGYPWHWSVYGWLEGKTANVDRIADLCRFATDLAEFLSALQKIDVSAAPRRGKRAFRGGSLAIWDEQTRSAIKLLRGQIDAVAAIAIWEAALQAPFLSDPVWFHGDVAAGNLLVQDGELSAVIDFGGLAVGDPACDMTIAWTLLTASSREVFRTALAVDDAIWARGRGWALWKGMIVLARLIQTNAVEADSAQYAVDELLNDYRSGSDMSRDAVAT